MTVGGERIKLVRILMRKGDDDTFIRVQILLDRFIRELIRSSYKCLNSSPMTKADTSKEYHP